MLASPMTEMISISRRIPVALAARDCEFIAGLNWISERRQPSRRCGKQLLAASGHWCSSSSSSSSSSQ
ncbi:hypothetical protein K0M31_009055 [Melipona bicolor]|uniref:Uncharacterized protein n=1 Tax=Melipona bicolor TaxID=60889 RepID=A0AA40FPD3_9HYME|nr:hypothetical protein K0M31_009055 [Melipona bicolor]